MQRQGGRGNLNAGDSGAARCQPQWQPLSRGRVQGPARSPAPRALPPLRPDCEKNPTPHWPVRAYESSRKPGPGQLAGALQIPVPDSTAATCQRTRAIPVSESAAQSARRSSPCAPATAASVRTLHVACVCALQYTAQLSTAQHSYLSSARLGSARLGSASRWLGWAWLGLAWLGWAWLGWAGLDWAAPV
jgi:hypothetical protein